MAQNNDDYSVNLRKLRNVVDLIRREDAEMPAQTLLALIEIAMSPGITQVELGQKLGTESSTANRIVKRLGKWKTFKTHEQVPGLKLVNSERRAADQRYVESTLTARGQQFLTKIAAATAGKL